MATDLTVRLLSDIRDAVRETNTRLDETRTELSARIDQTNTRIVESELRTATAITDLISGQVQLMFESLSSIAPFARSGEVRGLAVSGAKRSPAFPELPTIASMFGKRAA